MYPVTGKSAFRLQLSPSDPPRHFRMPRTQKHRPQTPKPRSWGVAIGVARTSVSGPSVFLGRAPFFMLLPKLGIGHTLATYPVTYYYKSVH